MTGCLFPKYITKKQTNWSKQGPMELVTIAISLPVLPGITPSLSRQLWLCLWWRNGCISKDQERRFQLRRPKKSRGYELNLDDTRRTGERAQNSHVVIFSCCNVGSEIFSPPRRRPWLFFLLASNVHPDWSEGRKVLDVTLPKIMWYKNVSFVMRHFYDRFFGWWGTDSGADVPAWLDFF